MSTYKAKQGNKPQPTDATRAKAISHLFSLILIGAISLVASLTGLSVSIYVLMRDRIDYSCEKNGHAYEPRYDTVPPGAADIQQLDFRDEGRRQAVLKEMTQQVYVGDTCRYCGNGVVRQRKPK